MIDFTLMNKAQKSICIGRFHLSENSAWTVISNEAKLNAITQEYKKVKRRTGVQQMHLTQPWENLKVLTTKATHNRFVKHVFEEELARK